MKTKYKYFIISLLFILPLHSCYIYDDRNIVNNAEGNFDMLWKICDEYYCYFDYKGIDWNSVYAKYRPYINNGMSDDELFNVCANMLAELKDGHVNLYNSYDVSKYWKWTEDYPENYSERIVLEKYLNNEYHRKSGFVYKVLPENIGYMHYDAFTSQFTDDFLDHVLTQFKDCKGVIIDIRSNGGGDMKNVNKLAYRFSKEESVLCGYKLYKTGPGHSEFADTIPDYLKREITSIGSIKDDKEPVKFLKDVVVLSNRGVYSAANDFIRTMKVLDNVTIIGDRSGGGGGIPCNFDLPNGWYVRLSTTPMLDVNKVHTEYGIDPTEGFKVDMAEDAHITGKDAILDRAIEFLSTK
ncbi:MAG: S41 family peptidase [Muribaculaceae bacterium]|nr:S41 family peptidase [Muribaculaceae bacterium]